VVHALGGDLGHLGLGEHAKLHKLAELDGGVLQA
jgi:hypothetical protein